MTMTPAVANSLSPPAQAQSHSAPAKTEFVSCLLDWLLMVLVTC